jgi:hypothetical protein
MDDEREKSRLKEATDKLGCLILPLDLGSGEMNVSWILVQITIIRCKLTKWSKGLVIE